LWCVPDQCGACGSRQLGASLRAKGHPHRCVQAQGCNGQRQRWRRGLNREGFGPPFFLGGARRMGLAAFNRQRQLAEQKKAMEEASNVTPPSSSERRGRKGARRKGGEKE